MMRTIIVLIAILAPTASMAQGLYCDTSEFTGSTVCGGTDSDGGNHIIYGQRGPFGSSSWSEQHGDKLTIYNCQTNSLTGSTACTSSGD